MPGSVPMLSVGESEAIRARSAAEQGNAAPSSALSLLRADHHDQGVTTYMSNREYYEILGLAPFTDGATVDQAYWHLAKTFQADAVHDPRARTALDELNEAYAVLGTPRLREEYDITLRSTPMSSKQQGRAEVTEDSANSRRSWLPFGKGGKSLRKDEDTLAPATRTQNQPVRRPKASDVASLQASTGQMLERWRANAGIQTEASQQSSAPDTTLVDIFRTEEELDQAQDPLNAVMDVLRSDRARVPTT